MVRALAAGLLLCLATPACSTYTDHLALGQKAFEASEHERALAIFRVLEPDVGRLSTAERAHYAYLRGMTDYRIGYKADARHWLALASATEQQTPGSLPPEWAKRLGDSIKELNENVYTGGIASLTDNPADTKVKASSEDEPPVDSAKKGDAADAEDKPAKASKGDAPAKP